MFIRLTCACLKEIYKYCGGAMAKNPVRPAYSFILVDVNDGGMTAYALGGYRIAKVHIVPEEWEGEGQFLLPVTKVPNRAAYCEISTKEDSTELVFSDGTTFCSKCPDPNFPSVQSLNANFKGCEEPKFSIWFDPRLLVEALKALQTGKSAVRLDFFSDVSPVIMRRKGDFKENKILVLPVKPPKEK